MTIFQVMTLFGGMLIGSVTEIEEFLNGVFMIFVGIVFDAITFFAVVWGMAHA